MGEMPKTNVATISIVRMTVVIFFFNEYKSYLIRFLILFRKTVSAQDTVWQAEELKEIFL